MFKQIKNINECPDINIVSDQTIRNNTRSIALNSKVPFVFTIHGAYLNEKCHIHSSYQESYYKNIIKI